MTTRRRFSCPRLTVLLCGLFGLLVSPWTFADAPFGPEQTIQTGIGGVNSIAAGDFDGTGGADIFHGTEGSQALTAVLQQPPGTWTPQVLSPGSRSRAVGVADLDGDGDDDLVYGDFNGGQVFWRENDLDTTGVFLARVQLASGIGGAQGLDIADLDGDTDLDVVVAGRTADGYFFLENTNGDASAWTRRTITTGVNAAQVVVAADLDGDGDLDVAGGSSSGSGKLAWYENVNGDGQTWLGRDILSGRFSAVAAGDLDLDGDQDLLVQDILADDILWFENTMGDGSAWAASVRISSFPASRSGLQAVDLDFDGDLDVVGDPNGDWWENIDKATSWTRRSYSNGTDFNDTDVFDLDGDGDLDIVTARAPTGQTSWFENLTCSPADADADSDGVRDGCDVCDGFDDTLDADGDLTPDGCDLCPDFDDRIDLDGDDVPDACASAASIAIDNVTTAEGDTGTTDFTFTVTLSGTVAGGFTVGYASQDQAATAGVDYLAAAGTLTFAGTDGEQRTLSVSVVGDGTVEDNESFLVVLAPPSSASVSLGDDTGLGTIFNDDTSAISIDDPSMLEGDAGMSGVTFTVTSTGTVEGGFTLDFRSSDDSATAADNDYVADSGTLTFAGSDGEQQTFTIQIVGDTTVEADERFSVNLRNPSRLGVTIPDGTGRATIRNDDVASLVVSDVTQVETDAGPTTFDFTVTLTGASVAGGFTVPYTTVDGTASAGDDYTAASGTLTFTGAVGETRQISVTVHGDTALEGDETFSVELAPPSVPGILVTQGTGTIDNDDSASLAIDDVSQAESDAGTIFQFTVTLTGEVESGFTIPYTSSDGTASSGDYSAASGTLSFSGTSGETRTIDVPVTGDTTVEADETFTVDLGAPSNTAITVSRASALGTIENDDAATLSIDDVALAEQGSGTTDFAFTVTLSHAVDGGVSVSYNTVDGTATAASGDYVSSSGTLSFDGTAGETETVTVSVAGDAVVEDDETLTVSLGAPSSSDVTLAAGGGVGTIENDDAASIAIDDVSLPETDADTTFTFTVTLTGLVESGFTVPYSTGLGTASSDDLTTVSGTLTFAGSAGETQAIDVPIDGDTVVEGDETFFILLGSPSDARITTTDGSGAGTLENDDAASISIDDVAQVETESDTSFRFTVTASGEVEGGFTVTYATAPGTAASGADFAPAASILSFSGADGETQTLDVTVRGETLVEADETFSVGLGSPSNPGVTVTQATGVGTIFNDDSASISIDDVTQPETDADTAFTFTVTLTGDVAGGFTVPYVTADGTATEPGADYLPVEDRLTFAGLDGETQTIDITVVGDVTVEADEDFSVRLGAPSKPDVTAADDEGTGTILNDDSASISIDDVTQLETDADTTFSFTVTLTGDVAGAFTLPYATADGTATDTSDYQPSTGTLSFAGTDGETRSIDITVAGDTLVEPDETFSVLLGTPSNAGVTAADSEGTGTIVDDDSASIEIDDVTQVETDADTTFTFTVTLTGNVAGGFTLPYVTADSTATDTSDYLPTAGTLTFAGNDGETQSIAVTVTGDLVVEPDETFSVLLGTPSNPDVTAADDEGTGTVLNDDDGALLIATLQVASYEPPFDRVLYLIEITNLGSGDQQDDPSSHELENLLPEDLLIFDAYSDSPDFPIDIDPAANVLYGNGLIPAGGTVRVTLDAIVRAAPGTEVINQATIRFDADRDGTNESIDVTDDPTIPGAGDPTGFVALSVADIPTLGLPGLALMVVLLTVAAWRTSRRRRRLCHTGTETSEHRHLP